MADKKKRAPTIAEARKLMRERREHRERVAAAQEAAAAKAAEPKAESPSILDRIRAAFSSEDDIRRIDDAVEAAEGTNRDRDSRDK